MELIMLLVPFIVSGVMFGIKLLVGYYATNNGPTSKPWLRALLVTLSFLGVVAGSVVSGNPLDPNVVSDWVWAVANTGLLAYFAHAFYNSAFRT